MGNGTNHVTIFTSTGFQPLTNDDYASAIETLRPDIAIPLADLNFTYSTPSSKRAVRMAERSEDWMVNLLEKWSPDQLQELKVSVFAPTLPVPYPTQWAYLDRLSELADRISGLAIYDTDILPDLKDYPALEPLPRLSLTLVTTPHHILRHVSLGADILLAPFINAASDSGVAFTFTFPPPVVDDTPSPVLPLAVDLSSSEFQTSLDPLSKGCTCYTCTKHHRAYINHLLNAREMLAWTLLQIHNHHTMNDFFAGIRASLATEPSRFQDGCRQFSRVYVSELPIGKGERPRVRGYHAKSEGHDEKRNRPGWGKLEEMQNGWKSNQPQSVPGDDGSDALAAHVTETPLVPDASARELDQKGFAEIEKG